ncbi:hydrogenase 4 subunit F [Candidatus Uhrbacteria bacterium]|nr:hydrogenase 4 subunit F [Candidatus Uhrbacteria bacterium]
MEFILVLLAPLIAAFISFIARTKRSLIIEIVTVCATVFELSIALLFSWRVANDGTITQASLLTLDSLGALCICVVALIGCVVAIYSVGYLREEMKRGIIGMRRIRQFYIFFHLLLFSMFAAILTTHPIFIWIAIEATTLSTVFLISFYGKPQSVEAAWKFFIINSVALLFGFFGTLLFLATPAVFEGTWFFAKGAVVDPMLLKIAFLLVFIGYGTKTGFAPLHTWLPDAHGMAPAPISSMLSATLLNVSFFALLRFKALIDPVIGAGFSQTLFLVFGTASIIVAALLIFCQHNYKRLLAYSSIEHMGIMALGFGAGGAGIGAALLHMIYHALTKSLLFLSSGNMLLKYGTAKIVAIKGMGAVLPLTSVLFFAGLLSIMAMPPFGMFFTEFSILSVLIFSHPGIAGLTISALAFIFIGVMKHFSSMMSGVPPGHVPCGEKNGFTTIPLFALVLMLAVLSVGIPPVLQVLLSRASELFLSL